MLNTKSTSNSKNSLSQTLFLFTASTLLLFAVILTVSPAVKLRKWNVEFLWLHWIGYGIWLSSSIWLWKIINKSLKTWDSFLFSTTQFMSGWGLLTIWRLNPYFGFRQSIWLIVCSIALVILVKTPSILDQLKKQKYTWLITGLLLIIFTFFFGTYPGGEGPKLWLGFGNLFFQPSEILKVILIIYLASYFSEKPSSQFDIINTLIPTLVLVIASLGLLIGQRDLGTALIFVAIYVMMIYYVFGKKRILLAGGIVLSLFAFIGFNFIDLIRMRFQAWILPWRDTQAGSYQIIQSIISIASGGLLGTGIGMGYPSLVPLAHSDFIFSAIAEETGLIGSVGFISLLALFLFRGIKIAIQSTDKFHKYLAFGITTYIIAQSILILGGNTRLLPITGVTLPFVSYGGSSLLTSYFALGLLLIISERNKEPHYHPPIWPPNKITIGIFSIFLFFLSLTMGWWGIIRSNAILEREDNARNLISTEYVRRGDILDRNHQILAETKGEPGSFFRFYPYAALSNTIGYIHKKYGLFGIEKTYDNYLRGKKGYPTHTIWINYLLYDQPPEGVPIRLTIDLDLQKRTDNLLNEFHGAAVVMNAENGEILAFATSPHFDANHLDKNWEYWSKNEDSPFLNRASQGAYPTGGLISPLLLFNQDIDQYKEVANSIFTSLDQDAPNCTVGFNYLNDVQVLVGNGCISGLLEIIQDEDISIIQNSNRFKYLLKSPDINLPAIPDYEITTEGDWLSLVNGENQLRSSPLQVAASFAPLSNNGFSIEPTIFSSVQISTGQWIIPPESEQNEIISYEQVEEITEFISNPSGSGWELTSITHELNNHFSWYVGGSRLTIAETPIVIAVVIETNNRKEVQYIGRQILASID